MKTEMERIWDLAIDKTKANPLRSGEYLILLVDELSEKKAYGGVDEEGSLLLAIEVNRKPPTAAIRSGVLDYFRVQRKGFDTWLMVLRLRAPELVPVFGRLCQDLVDEVQSAVDEGALVGLVHRRLTLWQKLFDDGRAGLLAEFQVKGLMAELFFMESILSLETHSVAAVAQAWVGPSGGDQDFQFSGEVFEVKAIGPDTQGITISSLKQLDCALPLSLSIWTLRPASPDEASADTLNALVSRLEACFTANAAALAKFRDALLEYGYVEHPYYDSIAFEPVRNNCFVVDEKFPRLTPSTVPPGIASAVYVVSLQAIGTGE